MVRAGVVLGIVGTSSGAPGRDRLQSCKITSQVQRKDTLPINRRCDETLIQAQALAVTRATTRPVSPR